ncbi:AraC-type DNA-binding protein [Lachnospiraceae bacterium]|nr:AraC-type DNA-binding protein [Lachnospiraceae bacterium]
MISSFVLSQMVGLIHAPIFVFDKNEKLRTSYGARPEEIQFFEKNKMIVRILNIKSKEESPFIVGDGSIVLASVAAIGGAGDFAVVGPVAAGGFDQCDYPAFERRFHMKHFGMVRIKMDEMVTGLIMLHYLLNGEQVTKAQFWENNQKYFSSVRNYKKDLVQDDFERNENSFLHNPYEEELRELKSIENADRKALAESISETYEGSIGILADDPLRSGKNVAIGNITLASRAAIRGGVSPEKSFSLTDSLIRKLEKIDNIPEVEAFKREAQYAFIGLVEQEKKAGADKARTENPVIRQVKNYIYSHLNSPIEVSEIAEALELNPDYLSHLFSVQEKITITDYIRKEKVRRGENLLRYSEYKIREISYYLGFCSQSHFSRVFKAVNGMTPNQYRKKYGTGTDWKIQKENVLYSA